MAEQQISTNLQTIQFRKDFFREYVRSNRLSPYSGKGVNNVICQKFGDSPTLRHPLVTRLTGSGVSGADQLRGNGESIGNYSWDTAPTYYRHAVEFNKEDYEKTNLALMEAARPLLLEWAMSATRDRQLRAMGSVYNGTTYAEHDAANYTAGIANTWQANNSDRILYGQVALTGVHATDLGGIDSSNDTFIYQRLDDMRRLAEDADPHIRPYQTNEEGEVYVVFAGSVAFNDLKASLVTVNTSADVRGMKITSGGNILARDGDLFWNGCIVRKVPEITQMFTATGNLLATAGAGSIKVEPVFLCGQQALVHGFGQAPDIIVDKKYDYGFRPGVAVELKEDVKKAYFNNIQHGMVTGFFSGA